MTKQPHHLRGLGSNNGPLSDLTVVEVGNEVATAFCGKLLTDLGAAVVRIQRDRLTEPEGGSARAALDAFLNTNKYGVSIDVEAHGGAEVFQCLVNRADAVIGFSTPTSPLREVDLAAQSRRTRHGLVLAILSWFGQTGPWCNFECDEFLAQHMSGLAFVTATRVADLEESPPLATPGHLASMVGGLTAATAVACAVAARDQSGVGDELDVSIVEALSSFLRVEVAHYSFGSGLISRLKQAVGPIAAVGQQPTADGVVDFIIRKEGAWRSLLDILGAPEWGSNELFETLSSRARYWDAIEPLLQEALRHYTTKYVFEEGQRRGIAVAPINTVAEAASAAQFQDRRFFRDAHDPTRGSIRYPGPPARDPHTEFVEPGAAPTHGRDNSIVLGDFLEYPPQELDKLAKAGVI